MVILGLGCLLLSGVTILSFFGLKPECGFGGLG